MSARMQVRTATIDDISQVLSLYKRVAAIPGGIARLDDEVDESYVRAFLSKANANDLALVVLDETEEVRAEIHAYTPGIYCFSHVLSDLTVVVDPCTQGMGVGRLLFEKFLTVVTEDHPEISRVELIARESNQKAIRFYESLGFRQEGILVSRIKNVDGSKESDIPMAWVRA
jgi:ribosomal protein S18 acetylase RimI-like enzyme